MLYLGISPEMEIFTMALNYIGLNALQSNDALSRDRAWQTKIKIWNNPFYFWKIGFTLKLIYT